MIGVIVVANRVGGFSHFDRADLDLFESLAHSVSVVLERGTLEQSLQQLRELEAALRHQANHDPLTSLDNRATWPPASWPKGGTSSAEPRRVRQRSRRAPASLPSRPESTWGGHGRVTPRWWSLARVSSAAGASGAFHGSSSRCSS